MGSWSFKQRSLAICLLGLAIGVASTAALWSCASLPEIPEGDCGNRVLEPPEACDSHPALLAPDAGDAGDAADASPHACGEKGTPGACRFICTYHGEYPVCPTDIGSQCGFDGICRVPGGISDTPLTVYGTGAERLFSDDFDGDGRVDVVAIGTSSIDIHFFAPSGSIEKTIATPVDAPRLPGIGDVNGDARSDLVLNLGASGLGVLLSQEDRTLVTRSYPTRIIPSQVEKLVALGPSQKGGMLLAFSRPFQKPNDPFQLSLLIPTRQTGNASTNVKFAGPQPVFSGELIGSIGVSNKPLFQGLSCRSVAFFLKTQSGIELNVIRCGNADDAQDWIQADLERTLFPNPKTSRGGAFFADLDKDGDEDLAYEITESDNTSVVYALINDGTQLADTPIVFAQSSGNACTKKFPNQLYGPPLAIGDIDGDGDVDIVDSGGVWFQNSQNDAVPRKCIGNGDGTWGEVGAWKAAAIGDFDGNGIADVLAVRSGEPVIDFWGGVGGGELNTVTISPGFDIQDLVVGDFDGDSISDAILRPYSAADNLGMGNGSDAGSLQGPPELFVMFGKPFSAPDAPVRLGQLDGIPTAIVAGDITGYNAAGEPDPLTDLAVITQIPNDIKMAEEEQVDQLSIIAGHPNRRLLAPLMLTESVALNVGQGTSARDGQPGQILISNFHSSYCQQFMASKDPNATRTQTPQTIAVLENGGSGIWLAGCDIHGQGIRIPTKDPIIVDPYHWQFLFPIQRDQETDSLGAFSVVPADSDAGVAEVSWIKSTDAGKSFAILHDNTAGDGTKILLPTNGNVDPFLIPYRSVDISGSEEDKNSKRDLAFVSDIGGANVVVYWNRSASASDDLKKTVRQDDRTLIPLAPEIYQSGMSGPMNGSTDRPFRDFVFMNIDGDPAKELVVLTQSGIYTVQATTDKNKKGADPEFGDATLFYSTFTGRALLAIDANSDGVDDLMLADDRKLLLFLGKEAGR